MSFQAWMTTICWSQQIFWTMLKLLLSILWRSMGFKITLNPTDCHCMDKRRLKISYSYLSNCFYKIKNKYKWFDIIQNNIKNIKNIYYLYISSSLSVGHSESRRMTDELGSRQRDLSTSSVTKRANGHWHAIIASSCRWSQREYKRQPVHRINHPFASEPSGGVHYCSSWRYEKLTSAGVTAQQRWSRSHGRTTVREDSHTGVCGGQLPCVLQH